MKVTFDVDERIWARHDQRLFDRARDERAAIVAAQQRSVLVAAVAALLLLGVCGLELAWLDDRRELSDGERLALRVLLIAASVALLGAIASAVAAAWPVARRHVDELVQLVRNPTPSANAERDRKLALAAVDDAQGLRERRARRFGWALALFAVGLVAVAAQAVLFAVVAGGAPPDDDPPVDDPLHALAVRHAPLIGLHAEERYGPLDPAMFVRRAALRWARGERDETVVRAGRLEPVAIGANCGEACPMRGPYPPFQLTRPYTPGTQRPLLLPPRQGFYLDGDALLRPGTLVPRPPVPLFYDARPAAGSQPLRITYWAFFTYGRPLRNRPPARGHEGDWEAVTIAFDARRQPTQVVIPRPQGPRRVAWSELERETTHPILYATAQSHELASHARTDPRPVCVAGVCRRRLRDDDLRWRAWRSGGVLPVREQPWYGFGGAWGRAGDANRTTGPLGPSRFRRGPQPPAAGDAEG